MATIKEYNLKLRSLKNTQKITRTMKMVSASKLRKAQMAQANSKVYAQNIRQLISRIAASVDRSSHALLASRSPVKNILILLFTSDKGLCGAFNHNVHRQVLQWIKEHQKDYEQIHLSCCGRRGFMYFHKKAQVKNYYEDMTLNPSFQNAIKIGKDLAAGYIAGQYDEVYVTHNQFFSPLSQKTTFEKILPIDPQAIFAQDMRVSTDYMFEPEQDELLQFLIPDYLYFRIYFTLLENSAGEHGARMTAMDSATNNASDMISRYTLLRNRARQAEITTELIEIIAGAEAL
ncbi:MAG TPA: ATP synthase F1 subunit gamma [Candidatus Omnitrophota bacterium]|nr:ATP synthase F1 subunit gamma [Candidatus Omnitrophota bacterium]